jgi:endonuclease YncB( thermonuclease family)
MFVYRSSQTFLPIAAAPIGHRLQRHQAQWPLLSPLGHRRAGKQANQRRWLARRQLGDEPTPSVDRGRNIICKEKDRYGRIVAICRASGEDIGAIMVHGTMAWAFSAIRDYVDQEARSKADGLGVHAHGQPACDLRAQQ